jgi:acyl-coenzyme A thioesterase PaaI-like protein
MPPVSARGEVVCTLVGNAYFEVRDESDEGGRYLSDPATAGPWDPGMQHGGPPNALVVRAAERLAWAAGSADSELVATRMAAEFLAPVPVGELTVRAELVRGGRNVTLVAVTLGADGSAPGQGVPRACLQARVWLVRRRDTAAIATDTGAKATPPAGPPSTFLRFPYAETIEWHADRGSPTRSGPAAVWARPRRSLIEGEQLSGLQRVALIADSASGVSAELDWAQWSFPNVDLDIHLVRAVRGEWLHLDARTQVGGDGVALARSTVSDLDGPMGATAQTLVLGPRRR